MLSKNNRNLLLIFFYISPQQDKIIKIDQVEQKTSYFKANFNSETFPSHDRLKKCFQNPDSKGKKKKRYKKQANKCVGRIKFRWSDILKKKKMKCINGLINRHRINFLTESGFRNLGKLRSQKMSFIKC